MARLHGQRGRVYLAITSGGTPTPVAFQNAWSFNAVTSQVEVTAFEDPNLVYVAGKPDASGDFTGFYDDATAQTYTAAIDGLPRGFYLYPNINNNGQYWYGTVLVDFAISGSTTSAVDLKSTWRAASAITKIG